MLEIALGSLKLFFGKRGILMIKLSLMKAQEKEFIRLTEEFLAEMEHEFSREEIFSRIDLLREVVNFHKGKYYAEDNPLISDAKYDKLFRLLGAWEEKYPELKTADSPTSEVASTIQSELKKVRHEKPMLSLDNAMNIDELFEWEKRLRNVLKTEEKLEYTVEVKLDGLAVCLLYENDKLVRGATRGDGEVGEDITLNLLTVKNIPEKINFSDFGIKKAEVRGEVVMNKDDFQELNKAREQDGEQLFSNPRNAAAGSVRQLDTAITANRPLKAYFFHLVIIEGNANIKTEMDSNDALKKLGFHGRPYLKKADTIEQIAEFCKELEGMREDFDFEIDGAVVKLNDLKLREQAGQTSHHPRWAIAFKFKAKQETTRIEQVEWQVGRTGVLTPVAHLKPVEINGVNVARATLHNYDEIERKDIREGDMVIVERAGDVIPYIHSVVQNARTGEEKKIVVPAHCPVCHTKTVQLEGEVAVRCPNVSCPKQIKERLIYFCSKQGLDITHLGDKVCGHLVDRGMVKDFADIFYLQEKDFMQLDLFKEKSSKNAIQAIAEAKKQPLWRLISALGIRYVGKRTARALEKNFANFEDLTRASQEDFENIYDVGIKVAESLVKFFADIENQKVFEKLKKAGVNMESHLRVEKKAAIFGKTFVFTGTLEKFSRDEAKEMVEKFGGQAAGSVSKNTDFVVAGPNAGSKKAKAESLGIKIISEEEFLEMLK